MCKLMCYPPCPWQTAASVFSQPKQNHSICLFREQILNCLERPLRTHRHPLIQWCLCVEKETTYVLFQKPREILPFSVLPWPQRDLSCCGPGGCRVLTSRYPKGSWTARTQATGSSICAGVRTPASLIKKLMGLWHPQENPWFSTHKIKPIPWGKEFLLMERTKIHMMVCLCIKINDALHF